MPALSRLQGRPPGRVRSFPGIPSTVLVLTWELRIPGCRSLKGKRTVVRSLKDRLRHGFNVSVAETGYQDEHDRAEVTVALVVSDGHLAQSVADKIDRFVVERSGAVVSRSKREIL
ncbi:MAG: DUF503 domain-containing protein [Gemmatimonadota bacterium]